MRTELKRQSFSDVLKPCPHNRPIEQKADFNFGSLVAVFSFLLLPCEDTSTNEFSGFRAKSKPVTTLCFLSSGRALLATRGRELSETLRRLADVLREVSKRQRHKEEKELFAAIADGAAAALWGTAKTMLSTVSQRDVSVMVPCAKC